MVAAATTTTMPPEQNHDTSDDQLQQNQQRRSEIYTYEAPWHIYAMNWSVRKDKKYRLAIASLLEQYPNRVEIVQLDDTNGEIRPDPNLSFEHPYPPTKLIFIPDKECQKPDLLATSSDFLRIWRIGNEDDVSNDGGGSTGRVEMKSLLNNNRNSEFCGPVTSFDWNEGDPRRIGTSSIDTTCTIWDIERETVDTQLIAHDKEVYDIAWGGVGVFASVSADGSVRVFDLRDKEHSTIIYESSEPDTPLVRLGWNKQDPRYMATIIMDSAKVVVLDIRFPTLPVVELQRHQASVNAIAWAPHSSCHICTAGDDSQALIWDLSSMGQPVEGGLDPILAYTAGAEIEQLQWSSSQPDWVAIAFASKLQILRFWSPHVGKHRSLTNIDQPSGVGVIEERLNSYMKNSKRNVLVVDDESEKEDIDPVARVFTRGLPEWTCDVTNYLSKYFPQQASAISCDLHGYLALPVFDSTACVGVIEILTSLEYLEFAYEVQQVYNALKKQNLTCTRVFDGPAAYVPDEWNKVLGILKSVCDIHGLPFAQTWAVSPFTTFVSHDASIKQSCSSFDTKCIGKTCMSTVFLPFYVCDKSMWTFQNACREQHLDSSHSLVGKALLSCGSCFCEDVTKLSKEEYPLVHNALMSGLTSCFAIFLHSVESQANYVLEFFLPSEMEDVSYVVQTLEQITGVGSGFVLGDTSPIDFSDISDSESTVVDGSHKGSSANESMGKIRAAIFTDDEEASSPLKKLKIYSDPVPSVTVKVTYEKCEKSFIFPVSPGLLELVNKVAEKFNLEAVTLRLKYWDSDKDLILVACDSDLADLVTCGSNSISLICVANRLC